MKSSTASLSSIRITPRKMGLVADQVRGKNLNDALMYLKFSPRKRTAKVLYTLLKSAAANLVQFGIHNIDHCMIAELLVSQGTTLKRFRARAKGSGTRINKKTSHIKVVLEETIG